MDEQPVDMPNEVPGPDPASGAAADPGAPRAAAPPADEWEELGRRVSELGDAIVAAVRAAADDPENRKRLDELKSGLESMVTVVGDAFSGASETNEGKRLGEAAERVAAAGRRAAEDMKPKIADVARKAGDVLKDAADRMQR